jgi:apoptotic chromatin condensation inducer in the nucleus
LQPAALLQKLSETGLVVSVQLTKMKDRAWVLFKEPAHAHATRHALQGVEWPEGNKSRLALQFIPAELAEYAVKEELQQEPTAAVVARLLRQASGGKEHQAGGDEAADNAADDAAAGAAAANGSAPAAADAGAKPSGVRGRGVPAAGSVQAAVAAAAAAVQQEQQQHGQQQKRKAPPQQPEPEPPLTLDDLFRKTEAKPQLYYLPLTDEQVAAKKQRQSNADNGAAASGGGGAKSEPLGPAVMEGLAAHHTNKH